MKKLLLLVVLLPVLAATAQPSATYYQSIDGLKKEELKKALRLIISNHTKLSYTGNLPGNYPNVYYLYDDEKGLSTARVYDLFSDEVFAFTSTTMWNKEHVIPQSWWNDKSSPAYSDIFSVIPSLSTANSNKSNYPPGIVNKSSSKAKDSGRLWTGPATNGTGGSYSNVWEPYDDFKGDFARIVMYVATCYADNPWGSNQNVVSEFNKEEWPTMNEWLYKLMLSWHNADPVSEKEKKLNNDAYDVQKNRNPFIDYPALADYIWGDYTAQPFDLSTATLYAHIGSGGTNYYTVTYMANGGLAAPAAQTTQDGRVTITTAQPYRFGYVFTGWNTRADGRGQAYAAGQTYTLSTNVTLYAQWAESGEHSDTRWQLVTSADDLAAGDSYIIAYNTASVVAASLSSTYLTTVAAAFSDDMTTLDVLPDGALTFVLGGTDGEWTFTAPDGTLGTTAAKKLAFSTGTTTWDITFAADGTATVASTNDSYGTLQYNAQAPRFTTYTSNQKPVQLYRQVKSTRRYTVTTTDFCYATLYLDYAVSIPDGAVAYFATLTDDAEAVLLHPVADVIPARTAVVVHADASTACTFTETALTSPTDVSGNLLIGYDADTPVTGTADVSHYALNRRQAESHQASLDGQGAKEEDDVNRRDADDIIGFFAPKGAGTPHGSFTAVAHKAYLRLTGHNADTPALSLRIDDATAITPPQSPSDPKTPLDPQSLGAPIYNLAGGRVHHLTPGIYITGGRKIIIRE